VDPFAELADALSFVWHQGMQRQLKNRRQSNLPGSPSLSNQVLLIDLTVRDYLESRQAQLPKTQSYRLP